MKKWLACLCLMSTSSLSYGDFSTLDGHYSINGTNNEGGGYYLGVTDPFNYGYSLTVYNGIVYIGGGNYLSHAGLHLGMRIRTPVGVKCTIENTNEVSNFSAITIKNCLSGLNGSFTLNHLPMKGINNGTYEWLVNADFDGKGEGTFTLTSKENPNDKFVEVPRPNIAPFKATLAEFLLMLY